MLETHFSLATAAPVETLFQKLTTLNEMKVIPLNVPHTSSVSLELIDEPDCYIAKLPLQLQSLDDLHCLVTHQMLHLFVSDEVLQEVHSFYNVTHVLDVDEQKICANFDEDHVFLYLPKLNA